MIAPRPLPSNSSGSSRLESIDLLRGIVMILMALDHTRDFFHRGAMLGEDPLDLAVTTPWLFLTRWITHFCAPVFVFLAGTGAYLSTTRGRTRSELSWFLLTRGVWLIVLELTWVRWLGWTFAVNLHEHWLLVIWAIGASMIVLAGLVHLPAPWILTFGLALIVGHNALDDFHAASWGNWTWVWQVLHDGGKFQLPILPGVQLGAGYPLIPWIGVMAVGYSFGELLELESRARQRWLIFLGSALTLGFLILRLSNAYGNPERWSELDTPGLSFMTILSCHKYPPSLCYLMMTLGQIGRASCRERV